MMSRLSNLVKRHPLITFFVLAYVITWGAMPFIGFFQSGAFIAALIMFPIIQGLSGLKELGSRMIRWRVRWYWYAVAIGLPIAALLLTVALNVALGAGTPSLVGMGSLSSILLLFALRLISPAFGPVGEEPGWRGFALPTLQASRSPLVATLILAVLVAVWHVPILFFEGNFQLPVVVGSVLGPFAFTFVATWLFNHTGGSVLMIIVMHAAEGTISPAALWSAPAAAAQGALLYSVVYCAVAIGLVIFDWKAWRAPAPTRATTTPTVMPPREARPVTP